MAARNTVVAGVARNTAVAVAVVEPLVAAVDDSVAAAQVAAGTEDNMAAVAVEGPADIVAADNTAVAGAGLRSPPPSL